MKRIPCILLLLAMFGLSHVAIAATSSQPEVQPESAVATAPDVDEQGEECNRLRERGADPDVIAQQGCCSWHNGVCGCSGTRVRCCDGSLSPSCGC